MKTHKIRTPRITDKQRIDALEKAALEEPLVLHDIASGGRRELAGNYRGLGLWVSTGRTLRQAIDQAFLRRDKQGRKS